MTETSISKNVSKAKSHEMVLFLRPTSGWAALNLKELWTYRELIYFLIWRDIKVRYKQTALGAAWAIIQPFFTMIVFTIFLAGWRKSPRITSLTPSFPTPGCSPGACLSMP